ncbi:hypothetical protein ACFODQ_05720 [Comamonas sp. JC664]
MITTVLREQGVHVNVPHNLSSIESLYALVHSDLKVGLISSLSKQAHTDPQLCYLPIARPQLARKICLMKHGKQADTRCWCKPSGHAVRDAVSRPDHRLLAAGQRLLALPSRRQCVIASATAPPCASLNTLWARHLAAHNKLPVLARAVWPMPGFKLLLGSSWR